MIDKLFMRVLGAISSALIIVSVFVPFSTIVDTGLFELYDNLDMIYVPITIIVFGAIGVLAFSINIKTEFAYTTVGAISFFLIMQTMEVLNNGIGLSKFSLGYYFLLIGDLLTLIFTFLSNLKRKKIVSPVIIEDNSSIPVSNQNIYSNLQGVNQVHQTPNINNMQQTQGLNMAINNQMQVPNLGINNQIQPQQPINQNINPINLDQTSVLNSNLISPNGNIKQINETHPQVSTEPINNANPISLEPIPELNVNLTSLNSNIPPIAPVIQPQNETVDMPKMNPVLAEFTNNNLQQVQNNKSNSTNTFLNNQVNQTNTNNQSNSTTPSSLDIFGR